MPWSGGLSMTEPAVCSPYSLGTCKSGFSGVWNARSFIKRNSMGLCPQADELLIENGFKV